MDGKRKLWIAGAAGLLTLGVIGGVALDGGNDPDQELQLIKPAADIGGDTSTTTASSSSTTTTSEPVPVVPSTTIEGTTTTPATTVVEPATTVVEPATTVVEPATTTTEQPYVSPTTAPDPCSFYPEPEPGDDFCQR